MRLRLFLLTAEKNGRAAVHGRPPLFREPAFLGRRSQMGVLDAIRRLELVEFGRNGKTILFHPETLCIFRVSRPAAAVIREAQNGAGEEDLCGRHNIGPADLERLFAPILTTISRQGRPLSQLDSGSQLKRNGILPKAVLMINNYCNLKCTYCYEHETVFSKKAIDMPAPVARTAIDKIYAAFEGVETWMFIGGEPTLSEDVVKVACPAPLSVPVPSVVVPLRNVTDPEGVPPDILTVATKVTSCPSVLGLAEEIVEVAVDCSM